MRVFMTLSLVAVALAGCTSGTDDIVLPPTDGILPLMNFNASIVDAALGYAADLYEPTIEVSDTGVIYITGHTILVDTTGAPVYMSKDDGASWSQLPFAGPAVMPGGLPGATPPPSDEIFLVAGDDGMLFGVDITLATFPVNAWCDDGASHCYHNPNAYDNVEARSQPCSIASVNDRPWAAYANGTLLMVNNPGGGPMQIGKMSVPTLPASPVPAEWNLCASSGGWIPGVPAMRQDGFFAVPQYDDGVFHVVTGNVADLDTVEQTDALEAKHRSVGGAANFGNTAFDNDGTLFVAAMSNHEKDDGVQGGFSVAASLDGKNFSQERFALDRPVEFFYMDGNPNGPGALVTWSEKNDSAEDWYAAHVQFVDGTVVLENVSFAGTTQGAYGHVIGSAVGPDGRAYLAAFNGPSGGPDYPGSTPLVVFVQQDGPRLPGFTQ